MSDRNNAIETLKRRWLRKKNEQMPDAILKLPFDRILRAVSLIEAGNDVFVPRPVVVAVDQNDAADSMMDWDSHGND